MDRALLVIDLQNDFYPNGSLAVPNGDEINNTINKLMKSGRYKAIVATQDWHPKNDKSFASTHNRKPFSEYNQGGIGPVLWPDHCVQNTKGAEFHPDIESEKFNLIIRKGYHYKVDSYSAFYENDGSNLGLAGYLQELNIDKVCIAGLALDYCVKYTALDSVKSGFDTTVVISATKAIEQDPKKLQKILDEMKNKGVTFKE
ncbi:MAG: bifunctional nicotinamidase/pyrazinamidase [Halanaerobiales bacterium]|nr:bifunctional nicotinamidase/pyrazinamidase [Halanaerobiales bacterium]